MVHMSICKMRYYTFYIHTLYFAASDKYIYNVSHSDKTCDVDVQFNTSTYRIAREKLIHMNHQNVVIILCDLPAKTCMTPEEVNWKLVFSVMNTIRIRVLRASCLTL